MGTNFRKFRNTNPISSKGGCHSIESSIDVKGRIANLARRLKLLETKESVPVNQVSPNPISNSGCTYCQAMNYVLEECPVFHAQQMLLEPMNAAFLRPHNNPYALTYNPGWRNHPNFSWSQNNHDHSRSNNCNHQTSFHNYHNNLSNHQSKISIYQ